MRAGLLETVDHVDVGCSLWKRRDPEFEQTPIGGTVVAIDTVARDETGEAMRRFAVLRNVNGRIRKVWIGADDVDVDSLQPPNIANVRSLWRVLCRDVALRKGTSAGDEGDLLRMAVQLYEAVSIR